MTEAPVTQSSVAPQVRDKLAIGKARIVEMLDERQTLARGSGTMMPSAYWTEFCSYFAYMLDLSEESLAQVRLHTYHLTGDTYQAYFFGTADGFARQTGLDALTHGLPARHYLSEPEGGIGFRLPDGRLVNRDIVRFQRVVGTLSRHGILAAVEAVTDRRRMSIEIGGGYGGLAHQLAGILDGTTFVLVDLPETLLFASAYLATFAPTKNVYVYSPGDYNDAIADDAITNYDFVLIPNYRLEALSHLRFDIAMNVASFQEMRTDQVASQLDFIRDTRTPVLYSLNRDRQPHNLEMMSVSSLLRERFDVEEILQRPARGVSLSRALRRMRRLARPGRAGGVGLPYREFLARSRDQ